MPDQTPKGDSQAGGLQESAVKIIKDDTRVIWMQFCEMHGIKSEVGNHRHKLLPWAVRYAGQMHTRTVKGSDGRTAWQRHKGGWKIYPRKALRWGEKVQYVQGGGKMKPQLEGKFAPEGIFVGFIERTEEYIIMTPDGCVKSKDVHRLRPYHDVKTSNVIRAKFPNDDMPSSTAASLGRSSMTHLAPVRSTTRAKRRISSPDRSGVSEVHNQSHVPTRSPSSGLSHPLFSSPISAAIVAPFAIQALS